MVKLLKLYTVPGLCEKIATLFVNGDDYLARYFSGKATVAEKALLCSVIDVVEG